MPNEARLTDRLLAVGALLTLFFLVVGTVPLLVTSVAPTVVPTFEPVSVGIGAASLLLSAITGSATFAGWMNNTRNRFMANLLYLTLDHHGPEINESQLRTDAEKMFKKIRTDIKQEKRNILGRITRGVELRQHLAEFEEDLYEDAMRRLRFEGYIVKDAKSGKFSWKSVVIRR